MNLIRKNWIGIAGLLIGVIGFSFAVYNYKTSKILREPVFLVHPVRTEILSSNRIKNTPIRVIKQDGHEIVSDLTSLRFFFWNMGKQSIKSQDILKNIIVTLEDQTGEIIDYKVLKVSRDITHFSLHRDTLQSKRQLIVNFDILEHNDGATCQLIYEGNPEAKLSISGIMEGVDAIKTSESIQRTKFWYQYFKKLYIIPLLIGGIILGALTRILMGKIEKSPTITKIASKFGPYFSFFMFIGGLVIIVYFLFIKPIETAKEEARRDIEQVAPITILPEKIKK